MNMEYEPRPRRWSYDEYIDVDGLKCVYTVNPQTGYVFVHLPGGATEGVEWLRAHGRTVTMPRILRVDEE